MTGTLSILSVYEGDIRITFDTSNPAETIRARRTIMEMMRRGYALLIEVNGAYQRALDFDEKVGEYIIADFDSVIAETAEAPETSIPTISLKDTNAQKQDEKKGRKNKEPKRPRRRVKMEAVNAVAVARSAGG